MDETILKILRQYILESIPTETVIKAIHQLEKVALDNNFMLYMSVMLIPNQFRTSNLIT